MDGGAATYAYDGEGQRVKKVTSSETRYFFYGPGGILCEFSTASGGGLSSATQAASTDRTLYRTSERTGSAVLLFDTSGRVIENNRTLPYGEAWLADSTPTTNAQKFTTFDRDNESGLDYGMARMYASTHGRFTKPDPVSSGSNLKSPRTWNAYVYSGNDPVNFKDENGKWSTPTHVDIMNRAFDDLPGHLQLVMRNASAEQDDHSGMLPWNAYQHGMRAPWETEEAAREKFNNYISDSRLAASVWLRLGFREEAHKEITKAIHAMLDSYSPKHINFQAWPDYIKGLMGMITHGAEELLADPPDAVKDWLAKQARDLYDSVFSNEDVERPDAYNIRRYRDLDLEHRAWELRVISNFRNSLGRRHDDVEFIVVPGHDDIR